MENQEESRVKAPGLIWQKRKTTYTPYWRSSEKGFKPAVFNMSHLRDRPEEMVAQCVSLQAEMRAWKSGLRQTIKSFDYTIDSILRKYEVDTDSPFFALRPGSRHPYKHYLERLSFAVGDRRIDEITGVDLKRWHDAWSKGGERLAAAKMMRAVLDAAISFFVMSQKPGSPELQAALNLREVLKTASRKLPAPKRRESVVTAEQVVALRASAHKDGRPSCALVYALVFETTLRLWDVIGQWWDMTEPLESDIISEPHRNQRKAKKWFGLRWEDIDANLVLRYVPSKTSAKTGLAVTFPLASAPMVVEELTHWPAEKRHGPVIVNESTGRPYNSNYFGEFWRVDREAAGIPENVWARDLRASGITEGRAAGTATDDVAKVAGHASTKTTSAIYDRATLEAAERFADARSKKRASKKAV